MNLFISPKPRSVGISLQRILSQRFFASVVKNEPSEKDLDIASLEDQTQLPENEIDGLTEEEIERKRNKSRLFSGDRNIVHNKAPRIEVMQRFHTTIKYKRRILGRYGMEACDAPLGIAWPSKEEVDDIKEFESVKYPQTLQEMWTTLAEKRRAEAERIRTRDKTVVENISKLDKWMADLNARVAKKEAEALAARERKERLMEEVRRHFGFQISPKDERFKELIAQKDKEEKKLKKAARKQVREQQMVARFAENTKALEKQKAKVEETTETSKEPTEGS